ncbi:cyclic nucleotide-binding domain-containing protein [Fibrobacterales bacterium]|nr:cyclic nucleotide-binding domain-containing protein [Fibrobacterales bacterium]
MNLAGGKVLKHLHPGEILFMEGEAASSMYLVKSGTIRILKREGSTMQELAKLESGALFGEMAIIDPAPRSATAQALNSTCVIEIQPTLLTSLIEQLPGWFGTLLKMLTSRLRETTKLHNDKKRNSGLHCLLYLILDNNLNTSNISTSLQKTSKQVQYIYGLAPIDTRNILKSLEKQKLLTIDKDSDNIQSSGAELKLLKQLYNYQLEGEEKFPTHIPKKWLTFLTQNTADFEKIEIELTELFALCDNKSEYMNSLQWIKSMGEPWGLSIIKGVKHHVLRLEKSHLEKLTLFYNSIDFFKNPLKN